jgi:urease subunit alpha
VIKGGFIAWAQMGDAGASIPTPQPVRMRPMFGARAAGPISLAFVSQRALAEGTAARLGLRKTLSAVRGCRSLRKSDMKLNDALPKLEVDPETYQVRADGVLLRCDAAARLPLAQLYCLF